MSKTQLQTNNAKLEALITELQGKAAGGGVGGESQPCTVLFKADPDIQIELGSVYYMTMDGYGPSGDWLLDYGETHVYENVKSGTAMVILAYEVDSPYALSTEGDLELLYFDGNYASIKVNGDGTLIFSRAD